MFSNSANGESTSLPDGGVERDRQSEGPAASGAESYCVAGLILKTGDHFTRGPDGIVLLKSGHLAIGYYVGNQPNPGAALAAVICELLTSTEISGLTFEDASRPASMMRYLQGKAARSLPNKFFQLLREFLSGSDALIAQRAARVLVKIHESVGPVLDFEMFLECFLRVDTVTLAKCSQILNAVLKPVPDPRLIEARCDEFRQVLLATGNRLRPHLGGLHSERTSDERSFDAALREVGDKLRRHEVRHRYAAGDRSVPKTEVRRLIRSETSARKIRLMVQENPTMKFDFRDEDG